MNRKKILQIIGYILVLILFVVLFINTDFKEIINTLKQTSIFVIILLIALQVLTQLLLGLQWHKITKNVLGHSKFHKIFYILSTGSVIEAITPGAKIGGEVTRLYYLKKELNADTEQSTSIILIQKSISMSVLFTICLISFLYLCRAISVNLSLLVQVLINIVCLILIILLIYFLFFSKNLSNILSKSNNKLITKINKYVTSYSNSTLLISKKEWIIQFSISILVWVLFPLKMAILAYSLGINVSFFITIAITMSSYMIGMLPLTPGGIGTFEGTMISLFSLISINTAVSSTITIVFRIITFWFVMLLSTVFVTIYKGRCKNGQDQKTDS